MTLTLKTDLRSQGPGDLSLMEMLSGLTGQPRTAAAMVNGKETRACVNGAQRPHAEDSAVENLAELADTAEQIDQSKKITPSRVR